jgi:MSHA biogenesis protein MshI
MAWSMTRKRQSGWLACTLHPDRIDLVHVKREPGGRPAVTLCDSYRKEGSAAHALARLRRSLNLDRYRVTTLLGREHYQLHQTDAPNVLPTELKAAVRWRVKDMIDYPLEGATVEVLEIPADRNAPTPDHTVYAVTARNGAVEACVRPFNDSGIVLEAIDIAELAQRNIAALFEPAGAGVVMLGIYADEGMLTFTRAGELYSARRIEVTSAQVIADDDRRRSSAFERIALEVQRSLDHLGRQFHYVPLVKVLLGPLPAETGLEDYLTANLSVPVETMDLRSVLDFEAVPPLRSAALQGHHLAGIGAALRDEPTAIA